MMDNILIQIFQDKAACIAKLEESKKMDRPDDKMKNLARLCVPLRFYKIYVPLGD